MLMFVSSRRFGELEIDQDLIGADHFVALGIVDFYVDQLQPVEPKHAKTA